MTISIENITNLIAEYVELARSNPILAFIFISTIILVVAPFVTDIKDAPHSNSDNWKYDDDDFLDNQQTKSINRTTNDP